MAGRALSERVKRQARQRVENTRMQAAVDEYLQQQIKPDGVKKRGLRPIAKDHNVNPNTLGRLVKGGVSMSAFNASKRKLTYAEERVLVDFILQSSDRALPLNYRNIEEHADAILHGRDPNAVGVGGSWVGRFLDRYRDEIQTHWSRPLVTERANALNPEAVKHWYTMVEKKIIDKGIKPENIYGMDESGFPPSDQGVQRVVGRRGSKIQHKAGSANRENITVLVTICADGTALKLTVIFKGQRILAKWSQDNVAGASICASENGWTDGGLAFDWIQKDFDPQTREKANGETRVLLMDGHSSHYTADLLEYCLANNIEVYGYPPHCTHALQGLDVVCFAKMKEVWKEEIRAFEKLHRHGVNKEDFLAVWGQAYLKAFTPENIRSAFEATGIHPFNPNVITPQQMKPSEATSTRATFPLTQTSPTRAVMAAFRNYEFTNAGTHPNSPPPQPGPSKFPSSIGRAPEPPAMESPPRAGPSTFPGSLISPTNINKRDAGPSELPGTPPTPASPCQKRALDPASNPDLPTPSKRMRLLGVGLANTDSGSILVTKARVTHLDMQKLIKEPVLERVPEEIPMPDWSLLHSTTPLSQYTRPDLETRCQLLELNLSHAYQRITAQNLINEGQNAQLIIQNMGMERMNLTLHEKENPKRTDRAALFPGGKGRHLTDPEVIQLKRRMEEEKKQKEQEKEQRKVAKQNKKASKERLEQRWKEVCVAHEVAVAEWTAECDRLRGAGAAVKDLPKKPKRPLKASLEERGEEESESKSDDD
ncbi:hypothetical protein NLJ89_g11469 [Agrocybe chaxingu]|uniref:HTH CENPB-type domain-containing protein n=1 Tax=Agrocybe chaxingu TaxID=84603 RepID=A0A9W8MRL5_9AGAR|nr:hypothetical protein NLJ89_g11469 [Agrocybe chaxingu]